MYLITYQSHTLSNLEVISENQQENRCITNEISKTAFNRRLRKTSWNSQESYIKFVEIVTQIYNDCFPKHHFKTRSNNKANT